MVRAGLPDFTAGQIVKVFAHAPRGRRASR